MRVVADSTQRDRRPSRTLMLLIGMTVVGLLVLIMLLALRSFPATNLVAN